MNYIRLDMADKNAISEMSDLASEIVKEHYDPILGSAQNDYMIQNFQSKKAIHMQLEQGYQYYFIYDNSNSKIGFLAFYLREDHVYMSKFYLKKTQRRKGISKDMLGFAIRKAKELGVYSIVLNVNKYNSAVYAYEKLGFVRIKEEKIDIGNGYYMDDYVYRYTFE